MFEYSTDIEGFTLKMFVALQQKLTDVSYKATIVQIHLIPVRRWLPGRS